MGIFCFLRGRVNNDYFLGILINRQGLSFNVLGFTSDVINQLLLIYFISVVSIIYSLLCALLRIIYVL
jgi:hypothetical protein